RQPPFKRKQIKGINLGVMYSMGIVKLCRMLGLTREEGREIFSTYHENLSFVRSLSNLATSIANDRGNIRTLLKRKRKFDLWEPVPEKAGDSEHRPMGVPLERARELWPGKRLQRFGTHKALNAIIQGSAADQTKKMMQILYYKYRKVPHLQVHDELGFSVE